MKLKIDFTTKCLIVAWLTSAFSFYFSTLYGSHWFSRSGSLIILFSVMAEYQLIIEKQNYIYLLVTKGRIQTEQSIRPKGNFEPSNAHKRKEIATHVSVVIGTLIWGYGDLFILA